MKRTILKYEIKIKNEFYIEMPHAAKILDVQMQNGEPHIWALVTTGNKTSTRYFRFFGTGEPFDISPNDRYVGTIQTPGFEWHLYEVIVS